MYLLVLVTKFAYIEVYQTTKSQSRTNNFLKTLVCADGLQHFHETNRINFFFTKYLRIFFLRHFYIFVAPNLSKKNNATSPKKKEKIF